MRRSVFAALCILASVSSTQAAEYGFTRGKTTVVVRLDLHPIGNTGTASVGYGDEEIDLNLENGNDPFHAENNSTEGRARDGTKFRIHKRKMQMKRPGSRHWITMRLKGRWEEKGQSSKKVAAGPFGDRGAPRAGGTPGRGLRCA